MSSSDARIEALRRMISTRPDDSRLHFGLAVELLNAGQTEAGVEALEGYLARADDEGNGWGRLAAALEGLGRVDEARAAYQKGIEAANRFGHPTMADDFEAALDAL